VARIPDVEDLADEVKEGGRRALARAITLVESEHPDHVRAGQRLLNALLPHTGRAIRVGVSGTPGVGKSTFIEAFGLHLVAEGHKVAVLAVDPSSPISGGSILGDKTRMEELSRSSHAFIRPSPSQGELGGVARRTREAMLLCEAAGYDVVIVETVGVGQSEIEVADMVDSFLLLLAPGGGDTLQGVKRGVLEISDLVVINKADGALLEVARRTRREYEMGLSLQKPTLEGWHVPVMLTSALDGVGIDAVWEKIREHRARLESTHIDGERALDAKRASQAERWMWSVVDHELKARFRGAPTVTAQLDDVRRAVRGGARSATDGALLLLAAFFGERH